MILASSSPRRKILLKKISDDFKIIVPDCDEIFNPNINVYENIMNIACQKAENVCQTHNITDEIIIGADTLCYFDGNTIGKPKDYDHAFNMIKSYNNKIQEVITGVSLVYKKNNYVNILKFYDISYVTFTNIEDCKISQWLDKNDYIDKAGAYAIQEKNNYFDIQLTGSYDNVVGLPIEKLQIALNKFSSNIISL